MEFMDCNTASQIAAEIAQRQDMWDIACAFIDSRIARGNELRINQCSMDLYNDRIEGDKQNMLFNPTLETGEWGTAVDSGATQQIYEAFDAAGYGNLSNEDIATVLWQMLLEQVLPAYEGYSVKTSSQSIPSTRAEFITIYW